ncbi:MAG: hypothetical protein WBD55_13315 [Dehalococcoidia bacterium]
MLKQVGSLVMIVAFAAIISIGCKSDKKNEPGATGTPSAAASETLPVDVDAVADFVASFIAYFPNEVQAHPGDTVEFTSHFTGEPHTVTLGTQVDDIFDLVAEACPNGGLADPACQEGPPEAYADRYGAADAKNPPLLPDDPTAPVPQAAGQPCFLAAGAPPTDGSACAEQEQTAFDGTQTFFNSGWLEDEQVFTVDLADNIAPGTYSYYCLLHREGMSGTITVVDENTPVPSADDVVAAGQAQLDEMVTGLQPEVDRLATLTADEAAAGSFSEAVQEATINEFAPDEIDIPVNGSVTWTVMGAHTISFNAPEDARPLLVKAADGTVSLNEKAATPAIIAGPPEANPDAPPPAPDAPPQLVDGGTWDGEGFASTGFIEAFEGPVQYKLTFSKAGTYTYLCLIHPDMEGTIKVE